MVFNPIDSTNYGVQPLHGGLFMSTIDGTQLKFKAADLTALKGGVVVKASAAGEIGLYVGTTDKALCPLGIYIGDAEDEPNTGTVLVGPALVLVSNWDKTIDPLSGFVLGGEITTTAAGLLTPRATNDARAVGIITKVPASTSDTLGILLGAPAVGNTLGLPASGTNGQVLTIVGGVPAWATPA